MSRMLGALVVSLVAGCDGGTYEPMMTTLPPQSAESVASVALAELDEESIGEVMTEVFLRHRMYAALRDALPLQLLLCETGCHDAAVQSEGVYTFELPMSCVVPSASTRGALLGQASPEHPCVDGLSWLSLEYRDVSVPGATVNGFEHRQVAEDEETLTEITVVMEHDGLVFDYTFMNGLLNSGDPVFRYEIERLGGVLVVQLTNPVTIGAYATATVVGQDGSLVCEIRASAWMPGDVARGTCEDGSVFGL